MALSDRIMFEIFREADYARQFRVVYFTELTEHNKEQEIGRAMAGEHFFDGFITERNKEAAKQFIADVLRRLNAGESVPPADVEAQLARIEAGA